MSMQRWSMQARVALTTAGALLMLAIGTALGVRLGGGDVTAVFQTSTVTVHGKQGNSSPAAQTVTVEAVNASSSSRQQPEVKTVTVPTTVATTETVTETETVTVTAAGTASAPAS